MDYRYIPFYVQGNAILGVYYSQLGMENDRDIEYVKEMYPQTINRLQELVEQETNRQEFVGSMMFDEYPDKMGVMRMVNRIFDMVKKEEMECRNEKECLIYPDDQWLKDIIMVLLLNEMYRRRQRRRRFY